MRLLPQLGRARPAGRFHHDGDRQPRHGGGQAQIWCPEPLEACHTAIVNGYFNRGTANRYVIEGHVPLERVSRLLEQNSPDVKGLAVPGMPAGSPGMEAPDGHREPFQVFSFDAAGRTVPIG